MNDASDGLPLILSDACTGKIRALGFYSSYLSLFLNPQLSIYLTKNLAFSIDMFSEVILICEIWKKKPFRQAVLFKARV